jgi:hypothetical protein
MASSLYPLPGLPAQSAVCAEPGPPRKRTLSPQCRRKQADSCLPSIQQQRIQICMRLPEHPAKYFPARFLSLTQSRSRPAFIAVTGRPPLRSAATPPSHFHGAPTTRISVLCSALSGSHCRSLLRPAGVAAPNCATGRLLSINEYFPAESLRFAGGNTNSPPRLHTADFDRHRVK